MALTSGTRLGPYEITGDIGAGGMGEVYKARDTRLDRTIAIKILPEMAAGRRAFPGDSSAPEGAIRRTVRAVDPPGGRVLLLPVGVRMRITSKGQVTIPQAIREKLGLLPHSEVEFDVVGNSVRIRKKGKRMTRGEMIVEHLRGTGNKRYTTDEIMAMMRGD